MFQAFGTIWIWFLQKIYHACVPQGQTCMNHVKDTFLYTVSYNLFFPFKFCRQCRSLGGRPCWNTHWRWTGNSLLLTTNLIGLSWTLVSFSWKGWADICHSYCKAVQGPDGRRQVINLDLFSQKCHWLFTYYI